MRRRSPKNEVMLTDEQHDDRDSFRRFVAAHERMVRAVLSRSEGNASDVEELCADVFVLAYGSSSKNWSRSTLHSSGCGWHERPAS